MNNPFTGEWTLSQEKYYQDMMYDGRSYSPESKRRMSDRSKMSNTNKYDNQFGTSNVNSNDFFGKYVQNRKLYGQRYDGNVARNNYNSGFDYPENVRYNNRFNNFTSYRDFPENLYGTASNRRRNYEEEDKHKNYYNSYRGSAYDRYYRGYGKHEGSYYPNIDQSYSLNGQNNERDKWYSRENQYGVEFNSRQSENQRRYNSQGRYPHQWTPSPYSGLNRQRVQYPNNDYENPSTHFPYNRYMNYNSRWPQDSHIPLLYGQPSEAVANQRERLVTYTSNYSNHTGRIECSHLS